MNGGAAQQLERVEGSGELSVRRTAGANRIERLVQEGAARIRFPAIRGDGPLEAVLINTAGGLTGGDHLAWRIAAGEGAALSATAPACERVYRSAGGAARVDVHIDAAAGAEVAWLPQETILYDRSALIRRIEVDLAQGARHLLAEPLVFGRKPMGETVRRTGFDDQWRIRVDGRLVHAEASRIDGDATAVLAAPATGHGATAFATVLLVADEAIDRLAAVRGLLDGFPAVRSGASAWRVGSTGKLLARLMAPDGRALREAVAPLLALLNGAVGLPKIWSN